MGWGVGVLIMIITIGHCRVAVVRVWNVQSAISPCMECTICSADTAGREPTYKSGPRSFVRWLPGPCLYVVFHTDCTFHKWTAWHSLF